MRADSIDRSFAERGPADRWPRDPDRRDRERRPVDELPSEPVAESVFSSFDTVSDDSDLAARPASFDSAEPLDRLDPLDLPLVSRTGAPPSPAPPSPAPPSLAAASLVAPSLVATSLVASSLVAPSLVAPSLVAPSVAAPRLALTGAGVGSGWANLELFEYAVDAIAVVG